MENNAILGNNSSSNQTTVRYNFPVVTGGNGFVCKIGRRIGKGSFGYVHEAKIIQNIKDKRSYNTEQIVVKFVDCSQQHNKFDLFVKELDANLEVKSHKLDGLTNMIDNGQVKPDQIKGLYGPQTYFVVLQKLGSTISELFDSNRK